MSTTTYAWIIDTDHLAGEGATDAAGTIGPSSAKGDTRDALVSNHSQSHEFQMFDADGALYYTGTLFWDDPDHVMENHLYRPLGDFGKSNGCATIKYAGRIQWESDVV